ncbi:MAG: hypothetical protein A2189_06380 [Paenibacillus sp. RIFOXYA1_FULL_44_5]|nr:MAG: hypothetical protein A2189_06380 [Paenibacillus sp. RIFOXYA1_FULL_44_5]
MKARISINSINAPKQQQGGFNYTLGIGYVNRADLLRQALDSIPMLWPNTFVVDNSEHRELQNHAEINGIVPIINPSVPLSFSQTMNLLQKEALNQGCEVLLFMHNDAIAHEGTPDRLLELIRSLQQEGRKWGAVFTHYDVLVAFNMKAVQEVGSWDTNLPQYFSDNDYYRRMRLAGYEMIESGLPVTHQNGSSTLHADPYRNMVNGILFPLHAQYYGKKWDGEPGSEQYSIPFNRTF